MFLSSLDVSIGTSEVPMRFCEHSGAPVFNASGWARAGDILAKEINMRLMTFNNLALKNDVKKMGGLTALWITPHIRNALVVVESLNALNVSPSYTSSLGLSHVQIFVCLVAGFIACLVVGIL